MSAFHAARGLLRSLLIYYAVPGRQRRMRAFYSQFVRPGDLCFDIGAHVGSRIRVWLALGARVVAVEPQPLLMRWLRLVYGRHPRVTLLPAAVGAESGAATLRISSRTPTVSTLSTDWIRRVRTDDSFAWVEWDRAVGVPVMTLDELVATYGEPAFTKIDIEGYEPEALRGLTTGLPALSFEHIGVTGGQTADCIRQLAALGDYAFNYSPGEQHRLQYPHWLGAAEMAEQAAALAGSGDVYARRR